MNLPAHRIRYSRSDYLALEASSNVKHEFLDGQIYGSRSTEDYDRGDKFEHYKHIETLEQYVLVSHRAREVEVWTRAGGEWTSMLVREGERAKLSSIGAELDVSELYAEATG